MHDTALIHAQHFFDCYGNCFGAKTRVKVVEIGSQDVNGSLRSKCPATFEYVGLDFVAGKGVDIVLQDPYQLPLASESADIVLSSSCLEHAEMFWLVFLEIMRILKPRGLFYLNVPSNGAFHRYPVDCWRFYPDSGKALEAWARRSGVNAALLESYTGYQREDIWNDFVAVFVKDAKFTADFPGRIVHRIKDYNNGLENGNPEFLRYSAFPEDSRKLNVISQVAANKVKVEF